MSPPARVLLVEDEAALRRFISMSLEDLPLTLIECDSVTQALSSLADAPADLILTDLMMPGESGLDFLEHLRKQPALRGQARIVVLSAGLTAAVRQQLEPYAVWRMLDKPISVRQLEATVQEALNATQAAEPPVKPETNARPDDTRSDAQKAADEYFEGDLAFFLSYRATCFAQFPLDAEQADQACATQDLKTLRLVVHSLKSVLLTLGYPRLGEQARYLENLCQQGDSAQAFAGWGALKAELLQLPATV